MKQIQYSKELLVDFEKLIRDFGIFMSLNLIHADQNLDPECQTKMKELIRSSLDNNKILVDFFETPVLAHEEKNKEKLMKNLGRILNFLDNYLRYAEKILKKCRLDIYEGRFLQIRKHYIEFYAKYLQTSI